MRKNNQIHTLGAPHYKAHFRYLRKLKDFKCTLWSEKYGNLIAFTKKLSALIKMNKLHAQVVHIAKYMNMVGGPFLVWGPRPRRLGPPTSGADYFQDLFLFKRHLDFPFEVANSIECLDLTEDYEKPSWRTLRSMNTKRFCCGCSVANGKCRSYRFSNVSEVEQRHSTLISAIFISLIVIYPTSPILFHSIMR